MPAYYVGRLKVLDQQRVDAYAEAAGPTLEKYGARILAAGPSVRNLAGERPEEDLVVIEFPSREQAEGFWDDPDYQAIVHLRAGALEIQLDLIEGE